MANDLNDQNKPKWTTLNKVENRQLNNNLEALLFNITCDRQQMSRLYFKIKLY